MSRDRNNDDPDAVTGSGFEKRGGYESSDQPSPSLPKVKGGPAPGAKAESAKSDADAD